MSKQKHKLRTGIEISKEATVAAASLSEKRIFQLNVFYDFWFIAVNILLICPEMMKKAVMNYVFVWFGKKWGFLLDQGTLQTARAECVCECFLSDIWLPQISNHCISTHPAIVTVKSSLSGRTAAALHFNFSVSWIMKKSFWNDKGENEMRTPHCILAVHQYEREGWMYCVSEPQKGL